MTPSNFSYAPLFVRIIQANVGPDRMTERAVIFVVVDTRIPVRGHQYGFVGKNDAT
jgi:hypothetical protein